MPEPSAVGEVAADLVASRTRPALPSFSPGKHVAHGASSLADIDTWRLDRFDDRYPTEAAVADALKTA